MERISKFRAMLLLLLVVAILAMYSVKLYTMQIVETKGDTDNTQTYTTLTRVKAARGDILDRNGNILVGNRASYDLVFNHYVIKSADNTNEHLYKLITKCKELSIQYADHFPVTKTYPFQYTLDEYTSAWRGYFQSFMQDRELDSDISAPLLVQELRERYKIPAEWSDEEARAVIALRYEFDLRGVTNLSNYVFIQDVSEQNLSTLLELNIPGLMVESSTVREYHTTYAAHILGSVGAMDEADWKYYKEQGYAMDAYIGQSGFEEAFEEELHAIDGTRVDVVDKNGTMISQYYANEYDDKGEIIGVKSPKAGNNVETTIDLELQMVAEDALADIMEYLVDPARNYTGEGLDAEGAAVVVMEVKTGDILVLASYPTFDLATLAESYKEIEQREFAPLFNRALSAAYPPGSTYKMCTLVAAYNNGHGNLATKIEDLGVFRKYEDSNFTPKCLLWTMAKASHGDIDCIKALEVSCNYFFYELGDRLKIEQLDHTAKMLGLGELSGQELPEVTGHRSNPESKAEQYTGLTSMWFTGDKILTAIGQSENRFTPMQLCVYASTLANRGVRMKATFLNRVVSADYRSLIRENEPAVLSNYDINEDAYQGYMQGMRAVISGSEGTGRAYFGGNKDATPWPAEIKVCAKTGTAQTFKNVSDHGAYVCFAPMEDPEIAIALYGEKVAHGSTLAVVAEAIMAAYFDMGIDGDVTAYENQLG